jgi:hypothetical protein
MQSSACFLGAQGLGAAVALLFYICLAYGLSRRGHTLPPWNEFDPAKCARWPFAAGKQPNAEKNWMA